MIRARFEEQGRSATVVSDRKAYGFWWSTADSQWTDSRDDLETVYRTFQPAR